MFSLSNHINTRNEIANSNEIAKLQKFLSSMIAIDWSAIETKEQALHAQALQQDAEIFLGELVQAFTRGELSYNEAVIRFESAL